MKIAGIKCSRYSIPCLLRIKLKNYTRKLKEEFTLANQQKNSKDWNNYIAKHRKATLALTKKICYYDRVRPTQLKKRRVFICLVALKGRSANEAYSSD